MPLTCCSMGNISHHYTAERIPTKNTHGTGCTYSSAIAANLALGLDMPAAVERAKAYVTMAIRHALAIGERAWANEPFL